MGLSRGDKDYLIPVKGINTESSPLAFPEDACVDSLNVQLDFDPLRIRVRKGLKKGVKGVLANTTTSTWSGYNPAISYYRWENVNNEAGLNFIVVQVGNRIFFYDDGDPDNVTIKPFALDLDDMKSGTTEGTLVLAESTQLEFTNVKGRLLVTSRAVNPTVISYDPVADEINTRALTLYIRDTQGLDDGLAIDERPASLSEEHEYNLYNQGWYQQRRTSAGGAYTDPVAAFYSKHSVYPSNADMVWTGMIENSGDLIFDAEWLKDQTFGSSPAPRGHYIVSAWNTDRETARGTPTTPTGRVGGSTGSGGLGGATGVVVPYYLP